MPAMAPPRPTDLNITFTDNFGNKSTIYDIGDRDVETLAFDAGQAVTAAFAELIRLDTLASVGTGTSGGAVTGLITAISLSTPVASVTISGLTRGLYYELAVTYTTSTGRKWTRTLFLRCAS